MKCSIHSASVTNQIADIILAQVPDIAASITEPGEQLMKLKFLQPGETVERRLALACAAFSDGTYQALRLARYIRNGWFMFATPLLANGGTNRGLPISCFLNHVDDTLESLAAHYTENIFLSTNGGGIGADWSSVRAAGTATSQGSEASGPIACIKVADSQVPAFRQGLTRQGAYAAYLRVDHPEILEFLTIRSNDGGNSARKSFNIHIGVSITNTFMEAVVADKPYNLICPHTGFITGTLIARDVWAEILRLRMTDRGEPYLFFVDRANEASPYKDLGAIKGSNLCTEITLRTDQDNTAVCCLSSVNARHYGEWTDNSHFIADMVEMLDTAVSVFTQSAPPELSRAVHSALSERSIGLGVMGLHSLLQTTHQLFEDNSGADVLARVQSRALAASRNMVEVLGYPNAVRGLDRRRNLHLIAIAPNASSSLMLGVSPGVEPWRSNIFTVVQGPLMFEVKNEELNHLITEYVWDIAPAEVTAGQIWEDIRQHGGSVQHLDWLSDEERDCFKTAAEIDQYKLVLNARLRQKFVCQAQSINLFFTPDADPREVNRVHLAAWSDDPSLPGVPLKSLYYLRTVVSDKVEHMPVATKRPTDEPQQAAQCDLENKDDCLACQG